MSNWYSKYIPQPLEQWLDTPEAKRYMSLSYFRKRTEGACKRTFDGSPREVWPWLLVGWNGGTRGVLFW